MLLLLGSLIKSVLLLIMETRAFVFLHCKVVVKDCPSDVSHLHHLCAINSYALDVH